MTAIDGYHIYNDHIDLFSPGCISSIYNAEMIQNIKSWIKEAKTLIKWAKNDYSRNAQICKYVAYMYGAVYGEDHTYIYE